MFEKVLLGEYISVSLLESIVGKCRSMAIAVPCAILYTRVQNAELSKVLSGKSNHIWAREKGKIRTSSRIREELMFFW